MHRRIDSSAHWTAALAGLALIPVSFAQVNVPPGYHIQQLTENGWREAFPRINNSGQIVFSRWSGPGNTSELILWEKETGEFTQLTDDADKDLFPDIADDGTIVWTKTMGPPDPNGFPTGETMLRRPDGTVIRLTDNDVHDVSPRVNNIGHVVWYRYTGEACGGVTMDVYFYDGSSVLAITEDGPSAQVVNQTALINDPDQIVWTTFNFCDNPWTSSVWLYDKGVVRRITTTQFEPAALSVNNQTVVAWTHRPPGGDAIQIWDNGEIVDLTDWGTAPVLNNAGHIAFIRWHAATRTWQQWLYRDGSFWQLSNDAFWNHTGDINDAGEVAWQSGPGATSDIRYLRRFGSGDLNCDGALDAFDIEPFICALMDPKGYTAQYPGCDLMLGDLNSDGVVDAFDIEPFIQHLIP